MTFRASVSHKVYLPGEVIAKHIRKQVSSNIAGLLVTGSVSLGSASIHSDLDLYAITFDAIERRFYRWTEAGVDVDLWLVTPQYVRAWLKSSPSMIYCFAIGKLLFDTNDVLSNLISEAQIRYSAGPPAQSTIEVAQLRHRVTTILEDCSRLLQTKSTEEATFFMNTALHSFLKIYCALERLWCHDERTILADMRQRSPGIFSIAENFLRAAEPEMRNALLTDLATAILKDVGGPLKYFNCAF